MSLSQDIRAYGSEVRVASLTHIVVVRARKGLEPFGKEPREEVHNILVLLCILVTLAVLAKECKLFRSGPRHKTRVFGR